MAPKHAQIFFPLNFFSTQLLFPNLYAQIHPPVMLTHQVPLLLGVLSPHLRSLQHPLMESLSKSFLYHAHRTGLLGFPVDGLCSLVHISCRDTGSPFFTHSLHVLDERYCVCAKAFSDLLLLNTKRYAGTNTCHRTSPTEQCGHKAPFWGSPEKPICAPHLEVYEP